ncbi:NUDIX hydrolase [Atribacter laminatus]|uniref:Mutator protein MutT4 n=1 Tax=Atribacter laminatus TaxID=2847778 RepID=A0A7T1AMR6_ATRLM|nr:NUDIX domain-containing protein [Atribacter laminatus]QPM68778.1 Putative mutator protein MutT4 [Atribacter laminatus]
MNITNVQACGGIVRKFEGQNQYILLIRKKNSPLWTLPKGHQENHESDQETAIREVQEETGYQCNIEKTAGEIKFQYQKNGQSFFERVKYFVMIPENNINAFDTEEIEEVRWVEIKEAKNFLFYQNEKDLIQIIIEKKF